jgi:hypothetical protein
MSILEDIVAKELQIARVKRELEALRIAAALLSGENEVPRESVIESEAYVDLPSRCSN